MGTIVRITADIVAVYGLAEDVEEHSPFFAATKNVPHSVDELNLRHH